MLGAVKYANNLYTARARQVKDQVLGKTTDGRASHTRKARNTGIVSSPAVRLGGEAGACRLHGGKVPLGELDTAVFSE